MSRKRDRFRMSEELGKRLKGLRERAGLTQAELAEFAGTDWDQALVSRLETAEHSNPTLGLLADYLRACRAGFADLADTLDAYTSQPRPAEQRGRRAVARASADLPVKTANAVLSYDIKTTLARRASGEPPLPAEERVRRVLNLAAAASRRKRLDILVKHLLDEVGHGFSFTERQFVDRFARRVWGALTSTRGKEQRLRVRRMARLMGDGIVEHVLPEAKVRLVRDRVTELFRAMEMTGKLATVPRPARPVPRRRPLQPKPGTLTPAMIAREANISEGLGPVVAVLQGRDRPQEGFVNLYVWLTKLAGAAYDTRPGAPEREQVLADALKDQPDQERARKLAELALDGLDRQLRRK